MEKLTIGQVRDLADAKRFVDQHVDALLQSDVHMMYLMLSADGDELVDELAAHIQARGATLVDSIAR